IHRVLRPGGRLALSVPHHDYPFWWDPINRCLEGWFGTHVPKDIWWLAGIWADHVRLYRPPELRHVLETAGFVVDEIVSHTHYCLPFHHLLVYGIGKNLLEHRLLPAGLAQSADRFRGEQSLGNP